MISVVISTMSTALTPSASALAIETGIAMHIHHSELVKVHEGNQYYKCKCGNIKAKHKNKDVPINEFFVKTGRWNKPERRAYPKPERKMKVHWVPLDFKCEDCAAAPGTKCITADGMPSTTHPARKRAAFGANHDY